MTHSHAVNTAVEKQKVFFFIPSLAGGGAERVMVDILRFIDRRTIQPVLLLLYSYEDSPYGAYLLADVPIIVVDRKSDSLFDKVRQAVSFLKIVSREKPKIILSMLTHTNIMAILSGILSKIKVIISEHNTLGKVISTKECRTILGVPVSPMVKILYQYADRIIAVSGGIHDNLVEEFRVPSDKIRVIYNPIDIPRIRRLFEVQMCHPFVSAPVPLIVSIGRLVPQKGFDFLVQAFGMVIAETDARLIIMGEGPERGPLEKLAEALGLSDRISFTGFQDNPCAFLAYADLYVLSSRYEGMPVSLLEAMACGVPVIASDCQSGPREILENGEDGTLVPVGDVEELAKAIVRLIKNKSLRAALSKTGVRRARDFSVEKVIKEYEDEITRLL